ncbi:uncharacterized protein EI90DRAFT_3137775 [Cantharellus anzutake]|uniref:uncharacterized protein n=1 Tax=Cantharellus anzutake TaxID=1750568 RepID=UPI0019069BBC|nr:uncharacterized protein EI90DRAFT_3137775 [Cantharellus anzutake]KAF8312043.1 hypothetical protein EI90DRAFT_3137775 [Cantharellus anzutake]
MSPTYGVLKTFYDFIIIGAGNAGSVVATRLSENRNFNVLVLEAGIQVPNSPGWSVPILAAQPGLTQYIWPFQSVPQAGLIDNKTVSVLRGKVTGGSTNANFMTYTRGSFEEYDRIANITGDERWSWNKILPFSQKSETLVPPTSGRDFPGDYDPNLYGDTGPILLSPPNDGSSIYERIKQAAQQNPNFGWNSDVNSGKPLGIGRTIATIGTGVRSSANNYLEAAGARGNLRVVTNAQVTRLLFSEGEDEEPVITGVEFAQSPNGKFIVRASKDVILSAGSINSAKLLLLSGVGPKEDLDKLGIKDHPLILNNWYVKSNETNDDLFRQPLSDWAKQQALLYETNKTGGWSDTVGQVIGALRLPEDDPVLEKAGDASAGSNTAHFEIFFNYGFANLRVSRPENGSFMTIVTAVLSPSSRGSVKLNSTNPFDDPLIDPELFKEDIDLHIALTSVKRAREFASADAVKGFFIEEFGELAKAKTDDEIKHYIRNNTVVYRHPACTLSLSAWNSTKGVVNPDLTVKGIKGLRVVDSSIFPHIPASHPQAVVYAIAERAADIIADDHRQAQTGGFLFVEAIRKLLEGFAFAFFE